jgi:DNA (cytosine-5)-methyltransferase 1
MVKTIRYIDLFCGLGAFHTSFDKASQDSDTQFECVYACDIDEGVRKVYQENYNFRPAGDITLVDPRHLPDFDVLCAGFPCQPFSIAGKKQAFDDEEKGNLFFNILEIIDAKNPQVLFLENVKNLQTVHEGETFARITEELKARDYMLSWKIIDSKNCGSPQSRHRIFIVGSRTGKQFQFPDAKKHPQTVSSIIDASNTNWLDYESKYELVPTSGKTGIMKYKLINKLTGLGGRQGERVYGIDNYGTTVCASSGGPGAKTGLYEVEPGLIRTLNVRETLQMFGFPVDFKYESLIEKYKSRSETKMLFYLGNSIVVNVLDTLVPELKKLFD